MAITIARIDPAACLKCKVCDAMIVCPKEIITRNESDDPLLNGTVLINEKLCLGCAKCERVCKGKAIKMIELK